MDNSSEDTRIKDEMTPEEIAECATTRATFINFLNVHFVTLPDLAFTQKTRSDAFRATLESLIADEALAGDMSAGALLMLAFIDDNAGEEDVEFSHMLGRDRTILYKGLTPKESPPTPCEAVWSKTRTNVTELLTELVGIYRQAGMALAEDANERLDFVGVELDFLRQLALKEAEAWQAGEQDEAWELLRQQADFFTVHMGDWIVAFIERALSMARTDFYRGHLTMLRGFITSEGEYFLAILQGSQD